MAWRLANVAALGLALPVWAGQSVRLPDVSADHYRGTATLITDGRVVVHGGSSGATVTEVFDPLTYTWTLGTPSITGNADHSAACLPDGRVVMIDYGSNLLVYNPVDGGWPTSSFPPMTDSAPNVLFPNGELLVLGGSDPGWVDQVWVIDSTTDSVRDGGRLGEITSGHTATLLSDGGVLVVSQSRVELFSVVDGQSLWNDPVTSDRAGHTATSLPDDSVLVVGGLTAPGPTLRIQGRTQIPAGSLNVERQLHSANLLPDGRVLIAGGSTIPADVKTNSMELYSPGLDSWSDAGTLIVNRVYHTATLLPSGRVLFVGTSTTDVSTELWDDFQPSCTAAPAVPYDGQLPSLAPLPSGAVLSCGASTCWTWQLGDGAWTQRPSPSTPHVDGTTTSLFDGRVLQIGGEANANVHLFSEVDGTWYRGQPLAEPREGHAAVLLGDGRVLIAGGRNPSTTATAAVYNPATDTWTAVPSMPDPREDFASVTLQDGDALVIGGWTGSARLATAARFRAASNDWAPIAPLPSSIRGMRAVRLDDGRVLAAGGEGSTPSSMAFVYDPVGDAWTSVGALPSARARMTVLRWPNGLFLFAGGDVSGTSLSEVSAFDPAAMSFRALPALADLRGHLASASLRDGRILLTGQDSTNPSGAAICDEGRNALPQFRPVLASAFGVLPGSNFTFTGQHFFGFSTASSGNMRSSASNLPVLQLRDAAGRAFSLRSTEWRDTFSTVVVPSALAPGTYQATATVNGIPSLASAVVVGQSIGASCDVANPCAIGFCSGSHCTPPPQIAELLPDGGDGGFDGGTGAAPRRNLTVGCGCGAVDGLSLFSALVILASFSARPFIRAAARNGTTRR